MIWRILVAPLLALALTACTSGPGKVPFLDARMLNEFNSQVVLGALYTERPARQATEPVSLNDLCLLTENHALGSIVPVTTRPTDVDITFKNDGSGSFSANGRLPMFTMALGGDSRLIDQVTVKLTGIEKQQYSNEQLDDIREALTSGPRCAGWLAKARGPVHQVKALYRANVTFEIKRGAGAGGSASLNTNPDAVDGKVTGQFGSDFNGLRSGEATLVAVELIERKDWLD